MSARQVGKDLSLLPIVEVAMSLPEASVARREPLSPVNQVVEKVASVLEALPIVRRREKVDDAPENTLDPEKILESARRVEEAAVIIKVPPAVIAVAFMVARVPVR